MMAAPSPSNEVARLAALGLYEILDTPSEPVFDELTELAAYVCGTTSAVITLVDTHRQWFKSRFAFEALETPRELAFCAHTIIESKLTIVPDALLDPRFADNPLVTEAPRIRFYAGTPLVTADGHALGSLAVIDYVPHQLDDGQQRALSALGHQVSAQLELRRRMLQERKVLQTQASDTESEKRALVESSLDCIIAIDHQGRVIEFNPAAERTFGRTRSDMLGKSMATLLIPPALRDAHHHGLAQYLAGGAPTVLNRRIETTALRADGSEFPIELTIVRLGDAAPPAFAGFIRDITERQQLEEQVRQSQKMEALGQLSGGVAHDFNNLLTVIQCNAMLLTGEVDPRETKERAKEILEASERAAGLTRQLLLVSRKQAMRPTVVDVNAVVADMTKMLGRILGEDVALKTRCAGGLPLVRADVGMLEQVLLNLAVNARDAMPGGGELTIVTGEQLADGEQTQRDFELSPGRYVWLSVADTGSGIAPHVLPHIFDPFFTTKEVGKGTGLGLATVYAIARQHRGWVEVASEVGRGSTFRIHLPVCDAKTTDAGAGRTSITPRLASGSETILVTEDEPVVRLLVANMLESCGYTVLQACSGVEALDTWSRHQGRIQLLLTDLIMPGGLNGRELAERLRAEAPDLAVVFTSGYNVDLPGQGEALVEGVNFLQKPYHPHKLAELVRARLDGSGPR